MICTLRSAGRHLTSSVCKQFWAFLNVIDRRVGGIPATSWLNRHTNRAALCLMCLCSGVFYSISVDMGIDPNRDKKPTVCQASLNKYYNFTLGADTLSLSSHYLELWDDRPWMEFNFTSLFTFFSLTHKHTQTDTHICASATHEKVIWDWESLAEKYGI